MPNHQTHDTVALLTTPAVAAASFAALTALGHGPTTAYEGAALVGIAHLGGSWLLSPDLDLDSAIDDRWGPLRFIWVPYMRVIPHRSPLSHSGISGALRLGYLWGVLMLLLVLFGGVGAAFGLAVPAYHQQFNAWLLGQAQDKTLPLALLIVGVIVSDLIHVVTDRLIRRRRR